MPMMIVLHPSRRISAAASGPFITGISKSKKTKSNCCSGSFESSTFFIVNTASEPLVASVKLQPRLPSRRHTILRFSMASSTTNTLRMDTLVVLLAFATASCREAGPSVRILVPSLSWSLRCSLLISWLAVTTECFNTGNSTMKVAPCPRPGEWADIFPLCRFTNPFVIQRPNPLPPPACSWLALNCTPSLNNNFMLSADNPGPESSTEINTEPAGSKSDRPFIGCLAGGSLPRDEPIAERNTLYPSVSM
mmetsp:Transcript_2300/g.3144  ORF Transcript_2300/g.3144 Transcript_2300/m.3144 type:complete len:250 (-) Transcript_2300:1958-2707(-)